MSNKKAIMDANEAAAHIGFNLSEVIAIYPITPSSPMGEFSDVWSAKNMKNVFGTVPRVYEMQSEGGAAGAVHGALQAGALSTTYTASQGLLLMIPNMYKIAGELTPTVFHVAARTLAAHALSIFGDHSDVYACRQTGFAMLASSSVQESMDMGLIAHMATLKASVPFMHFFDGFRTSHEIMKIDTISQEEIRSLIDIKDILAHRKRGLSPDNPCIRGTAQNADVFFQSREAANVYYEKTPQIVKEAMEKLEKLTGRHYDLFDYYGAKDADRILILMGSGAETAQEVVDYMNSKMNEKVGVLKVHLYRPFSVKDFIDSIPTSVKSIAVLDRTKEAGSLGEPLYLDTVAAFAESDRKVKIIGGRYGLSSKEFTPAMIKAVYDELKKENPKNHFTVGINDDLTHTSLDYDPNFRTEDESTFRGIFIGLGSDGTVGANKNSIKIIGEETDNYTQGYFVYDSKKSGGLTKSHLRFGKNKIKSIYLIDNANFVACHQFSFVEKLDVLREAAKGATFLLNAPYDKDEVWDKLPKELQQDIIDKEIEFYAINAYDVALKNGMGTRTNTIMQTCFFAIANILPKNEAIEKIKEAIKKTFGKKGDEVVQKNFKVVDESLVHLHKIDYPKEATSKITRKKAVSDKAPEFVKKVLAPMMVGDGENLKVSELPADGTFPSATTKWEKRAIALSVPEWDPEACIQCGKCSIVCPHGVIRMKAYDEAKLKDAPSGFKSCDVLDKTFPEGTKFTLQLSTEDCTGCGLCVENCPVKSKKIEGGKALNFVPFEPIREREVENWEFFNSIDYVDRSKVKHDTVKGSQLLEPLFEFSGACQGCGETPYVKLVTQLFGDRMLIANATGCSSIYGGNLPTTPYAKNKDGRGPAWANSLFEDNAEFGLGFRLAVDKKQVQAKELLLKLKSQVGESLANDILNASQETEEEITAQRARVEELKNKLKDDNSDDALELVSLSDYLIKKSVWIFGGDGWAYDIGYGGLDHVLASGQNVNVLLLDTEVYSNTGGQMSKSTPTGAVAQFAAAGKANRKKDIGLHAMSYKNVYVASISLGANDAHALKAIIEAEKHDGPSLIICYAHCIAHGINLRNGLTQQKNAVNSGHWLLYRYNPANVNEGKNPLTLDSKEPSIPLTNYIYNENRYKMLVKSNPERAEQLANVAQKNVQERFEYYKKLASM
ncbi:MAG: pyruvate:ferredoxin (flavodoxin) oxidoreductase [Bdellovibrionota bacterium]